MAAAAGDGAPPGPESLLSDAGLPAPAGDPLAHASPGVTVRIGMWHWV
ncbi:MAG TPA: hypothetical protein VF838_05565 [Trebonia sp.]